VFRVFVKREPSGLRFASRPLGAGRPSRASPCATSYNHRRAVSLSSGAQAVSSAPGPGPESIIES